MKNLSEIFTSLSNESIKDDFVEDKTENFSFVISQEHKEQSVKSANFEKKELIYFVPKNPIFKTGSLLSYSGKPLNEYMGESGYPGALKACDEDSAESYLKELVNVKETTQIGKFETIQNLNLMILDEIIEIKKITKFKLKESGSSETKTHKVNYQVTHYIQTLNGKEKIYIATKMFGKYNTKSDNVEYWDGGNTMFFDNELSLTEIENIYKSTDPEDIMKPIKILDTQK